VLPSARASLELLSTRDQNAMQLYTGFLNKVETQYKVALTDRIAVNVADTSVGSF
jgi:hypothetical protein